ncbi:hypothetical protein RZS28_06055 [Methylocapsa polymorpha]|uniref:DUF4412 domain-containing protein n=1 Tax=Methylocapsa polymorpha TaxID=3080828 RepID=A0ABZ0HVW9_9HYPH|nr:hypothetical protein RZS28_06055 [Methylocapsa sp. RX1]
MIAALLTLGALAWLSLFAPVAKASQFSADIISTKANGEPLSSPGRLYVSGDKARIETPAVAGGFFVVDGTVNAAFFVRPAKKIFMDAKQSSPLTQILVPVDPEDPCRKWQAMAVNAGATETGGEWRCDRADQETIEGRKAIAYSAVSPSQEQSIEWIDPGLKFLIRSQTNGGVTVDLKNIQEGPQPASLFEIPANFGKFDPRQLIEIIKRSDVWVEPVK